MFCPLSPHSSEVRSRFSFLVQIDIKQMLSCVLLSIENGRCVTSSLVGKNELQRRSKHVFAINIAIVFESDPVVPGSVLAVTSQRGWRLSRGAHPALPPPTLASHPPSPSPSFPMGLSLPLGPHSVESPLSLIFLAFQSLSLWSGAQDSHLSL